MSWGGAQQPAWEPQQPYQQHQQQYGDSQSYRQQSGSNYYQQPQGYQQPGHMPTHPSYPQQPAHHMQVQRRVQFVSLRKCVFAFAVQAAGTHCICFGACIVGCPCGYSFLLALRTKINYALRVAIRSTLRHD